MERVGSGGGSVVGEEVSDSRQTELMSLARRISIERDFEVEKSHIVPTFSTDTLDDDVHDIDGEIEVRLLLHERTETMQRSGSER